MQKIKLFIAQSLDGFIARPDGSLDWLLNLPNPHLIDHGYAALMADTDVVVMSRPTYEVLIGFEMKWPYAGLTTFVATTNPSFVPKTKDTCIIHAINRGSIRQICSSGQKNIWLVGGGKLVSAFLALDAIDTIIISIIPVVLGAGIPLFPNITSELWFDLVKVMPFDTGVVNLTYELKK